MSERLHFDSIEASRAQVISSHHCRAPTKLSFSAFFEVPLPVSFCYTKRPRSHNWGVVLNTLKPSSNKWGGGGAPASSTQLQAREEQLGLQAV